MKKLLSVLLCAIFLLGMTVVSVSAEEADGLLRDEEIAPLVRAASASGATGRGI